MTQNTSTMIDLHTSVGHYIASLEERLSSGEYHIRTTTLCSEIADLVFDARGRFDQLPPGIEVLRQNWVSLSKSANANDHLAHSKAMVEVIKFMKKGLTGSHTDGVDD